MWSLLPGGAHLEHLKKGDIVFNASQTKALLEHGRISGHARAYADGTLSTQTGNYYGLYKAYASGVANGGGVLGGGPVHRPSSNSSSHSNSHSYNTNTGAVNSNTKATNDNTKAAKKSTQVFDWVERRLKYFADKTKAIADSINDYLLIVLHILTAIPIIPIQAQSTAIQRLPMTTPKQPRNPHRYLTGLNAG